MSEVKGSFPLLAVGQPISNFISVQEKLFLKGGNGKESIFEGITAQPLTTFHKNVRNSPKGS